MTRRLCLAIGVSTVTPPRNQAMAFPYLDGAVFAARAIGEWALNAGFGDANVQVIDDGKVSNLIQPVTCERVQQAVDKLFPLDADTVDQLILAFCGHGLTETTVGAISWIFSDSIERKYRILADSFITELLLHGVKRITLISDACREAPKNLDLMRLDAIRGIVVQGNLVASPKFDRLVACQDGQLGYMVSEPTSAAPGKCVFSGVIADALWGKEPGAIIDGVITTASLGLCVRARARERASEYRLKLEPQCLVDPEPAILYDTAKPLPQPQSLQPWPAASSAAVLGLAESISAIKDKERVLTLVHADPAFRNRILGPHFGLRLHAVQALGHRRFAIPEESGDVLNELVTLREGKLNPEKKQKVRSLITRLEADTNVEMRRRKASTLRDKLERFMPFGPHQIIVQDASAQIMSNGAVVRVNSKPSLSCFDLDERVPPTAMLVSLSNGTFTPVVPYRGLHTFIVTDSSGNVFQAYGKPSLHEVYKDTVRAITDYAAGRLRVEDVNELARLLHLHDLGDPVIGVLCAYLYRAIADYDSIRRLAHLYAGAGQSVPFDIAMLGEMAVTRNENGGLQVLVPAASLRRTEASVHNAPLHDSIFKPDIVATIGGVCPWLSLGWDYVKHPRANWAALVDGLTKYKNSVPRIGFTVFSNATGLRFAMACNLQTASLVR